MQATVLAAADPRPLLARRLDDALPQTQCTRCGYPDCRSYANAMANGEAPINRCPPGGAEGIERLSRLIGTPVLPLDPANGAEGPIRLALIDEQWCIGCTLCLDACPVDCIVGASKQMHTVIASQCTGCELCIPACPVDCITLAETNDGATGWAAWSPRQAEEARGRYEFRQLRLQREHTAAEARLAERSAAVAHAALADAQGSAEKSAAMAAAEAGSDAQAHASLEAGSSSNAARGTEQDTEPGTRQNAAPQPADTKRAAIEAALARARARQGRA